MARKLQIHSLSFIVPMLRVITTEIDVPTSDGRIARIALYSLPEETIQAAGERGQAFIAESVAARRKA